MTQRTPLAVPLGERHPAPDYVDRRGSFSVSAQDWMQQRIWSSREKVAESRGSRAVEVHGPEVPGGCVVELWARVGPVRSLRQSVAGPLPQGMWFRRVGEPVEVWEVWAYGPGVSERNGVALFESVGLYFAKAD